MFDKDLAIQKKNEIQEIAIEGSKGYLRMLLTWATGCGKSLGALKIIKNDYDKNPNIKGYLICSESNHLSNWEDDIKEHDMNFIENCSEKFLYASLHKYVDNGFVDFVILDEVHNITNKRLEHLKKIIGPNTRLVMLSATVNDNKMLMLRHLAKPFGVYEITISQAIEAGILPSPKVYVHILQLDNQYKIETLRLKRNFKEVTLSNLTQKEAYKILSAEIEIYLELYENEGKNWQRNLAVNLGSKRKRMLSEFKTSFAKSLINDEFSESRNIVFTGSKKQANELGKYPIHSGFSKSQNLEMKNKFNNLEIDSLTLVDMFREGMNLFNIEKGLIVQLDNVKLTFIQMLGRVFRSVLPEMHLLVYKDTQDEKYLKNVLYGFNEKYVEYINYD